MQVPVEKLKISAKDILDDIRSGLSNEELKARHNLSQNQLQSLFTKLKEAGFITPAQLEGRSYIELPEVASWACPACGEPQERQFEKCPECGVDVAAFKARQVISSWEPSAGLEPLLKELEGAGALKEPASGQKHNEANTPLSMTVTECPACGKGQPEPFNECPVCGIVVIRYLEQQKQKDRKSENSSLSMRPTITEKQTERPVPDSLPGSAPAGLSQPSAAVEGISKQGTPALGAMTSEVGAKILQPSVNRVSRTIGDSEQKNISRDLRTLGKYFTYIGLVMAAVGLLGGLLQLILGYGAFSFIILGCSILLIVIGGPVWLICSGIAEALESSEEISEKLEEHSVLLTQLLKKLDEEKQVKTQ